MPCAVDICSIGNASEQPGTAHLVLFTQPATLYSHPSLCIPCAVDIRSIGNAMLHMVDNLVQPIPVDTFLMRMHDESFKVGVGGGQVG